MKRGIYFLFSLLLLLSCNGKKESTVVEKSDSDAAIVQKRHDDSIRIAKEKETERIRKRKAEEDSIKQVQDSLNAVRVNELMKNFRVKEDEFSTLNMKWFEHKISPRYRNSNGFYFYFGVSDAGVGPLRMVLQYYSDDWLFVDRVSFSIDGEAYYYKPDDMKRDNGYGGKIWEWFDETISVNSDLVQALIQAKSVKIKLNGSKYYDTRTLNSGQIKALKDTHELYMLLK